MADQDMTPVEEERKARLERTDSATVSEGSQRAEAFKTGEMVENKTFLSGIFDLAQQVRCDIRATLTNLGVPVEDFERIVNSVVSKIVDETLYYNAGKLEQKLDDVIKGTIKLEEEKLEKTEDDKEKAKRQNFLCLLRVVQENVNIIAKNLHDQFVSRQDFLKKQQESERQSQQENKFDIPQEVIDEIAMLVIKRVR